MHRFHRMKNFEVARQFDLMADVLELKGENPFRIRAYRRAAQNLESLTEDLQALAREDRPEEIPGIGADLAGKIQEYLRTGGIREVAAESKGIPRGVVALMNVPGVGPKTARLLYECEGITGMDQREKLARKGGLRGLPGIQVGAFILWRAIIVIALTATLGCVVGHVIGALWNWTHRA
jgi:DNA polymerase (family 10)